MILKKIAGFKFFTYLTIIISVFTVLTGWVGSFDPANWWFLSITGLVFPLFFILNVLFIILALIFKRKLVFVPLVALLVTVVKLPALVQFNDSDKAPVYTEDQSVEIKFMSFNVRLFDLYNWSHNYQTRDQIFDFLEQQQMDIVCFQEFYSSDRDNMDNASALKKHLKTKYSHIEYPVNKYTTDHYGIATFSKFPVINKGVLYLDKLSTNICIFSDLKIDDDTVRIYNCHLQSVRFGTEDYKFIEDIRKSGQDTETIKRTRTIVGRLKRAFIKRAAQADMIARHISESPHPVIICGDFNDTPISFAYNIIAGDLKDAFRESGRGTGSSYAGPIPGLRIDYILHSPEIVSYKFKTHKVKLSDHYPIETRFVIKP